jgi:hypothetical protein
MLISGFLAVLFFFSQVLLSIATALFAVSSLDDPCSDVLLLIRYRPESIVPDHHHKSIRRKDIVNLPEKSPAILLTARREAAFLIQSASNIIYSVAC